ncbi:UNC93-like protein 3 [Physcomitrium patens]|uniref:UNC93-like protein n=1 Tax=Physcomitrium patens TaxID=3218 RepID=A0A2K1K5P1_PHYPA|nr:UNC93-like protein 3 [Physcomitrium patens]PNR49096.1 hypothetical protein PHYPA_010992 [Physcomitrium patens]|eukprot:XP_024382597.1 UNC93-like protein 3 [Physcomitrella patens]
MTGSSEDDSFFNIPPNPSVPLGDNLPVLTRSDSSIGNWSPYLRDLHILSFSFLFTFLAYSALQNLESSIHEDDGLGSTSVGVLYLSLTFSSLGAPLFVVWLGTKRALLVGLSGYWVFTAANLYPTWTTMIPASLFLGFTASILWCAEGTYLTCAAKRHAISCNISEETAIGTFNGEFWSLFASNQVVGNLVSLGLLYYGKGSSGSGDSSSGTTLLVIVFLGSMAVGTTLAFFLTPQYSSYSTISEDSLPLTPAGNRDLAKRMFALLHEKKMVMLIGILIYTGLQQAFIWGDFTKDIITPAFGVAWVGGVMAIYGASDAISSVVAGRFSTGVPAIAAITCVGAIAQGFALTLLCFKQQFGGGGIDLLLLSGLAIAWGVGDATFNTQISALLGIFYPDDTEAAFAQWKIWQSAATSAAFFASPRTDFFIKLYVLLAVLVLSMVALLFVIMRQNGSGARR